MKTALLALALAAVSVTAQDPSATTKYITSTQCFTAFAYKSAVPVTYTKTNSDTITATTTTTIVKTTTPKTTVTRVPKTVYRKSTIVNTQTFVAPAETTYETVYQTTTNTITENAPEQTAFVTQYTGTASTVTVTSTSTVPPPAGFVPINSANAASRAGIRRSPPTAAPLLVRGADRPESLLSPKNQKQKRHETYETLMRRARYPTTVSCNVDVKEQVKTTSTVVLPTSTVTTGPYTTYVTRGSTTVVSTSTIVPSPINSQTTVHVDEYYTQTVTPTATRTTTLPAPTATHTSVSKYYAQCAPGYNQLPVIGGTAYPYDDYSDASLDWGVASAYDCCVRCVDNPSCSSSYFADGQGACIQNLLGEGQVCWASLQQGQYEDTPGMGRYDYIIMNGCATWHRAAE